ncbi:hypothetical protein D3C78_1486760 [compost metagenome]
MAKGGSGNRLVMLGKHPQISPRIALLELGAVFIGDRYAQAGKINGRMPGFGTAFEHRQPILGVGNAQ